ncbi:MAG: hypothetical protein OEN21_12050 [Myxococcales bacterium]|nr:hypothetical protein [Myxococcales bacterium]
MKKNAHAILRACSSLVFVCALGLSGGCLYMGDPGHVEADPSAIVGMEGARLELIRHSTGCGSGESEGLIAEVGPWVEYSADAVSALKANCERAPHPGVEVHVDGNAVVFDFSNVAAPGRFPANEFEGYILDMVRTADAPVLIAALVDLKLTTLDLVQDDLTYDRDRLAVNLAGLRFDSNSFIRLELYLDEVSEPTDEDSSESM